MSAKHSSCTAGFTLLEVMLAVAVLAVVSVSIYRFVSAALEGVRVAQERTLQWEDSEALARYLRAELLTLRGPLTGEAHRFNGVSSDEMSWSSRAGSGLLTRHASGEWWVTLTAWQRGGGEYELGMRRQDSERKRSPQWLPLSSRVRGFEVRYFDNGRRQWLEKWTDQKRRPALIRVKYWRAPLPDAYEVVLPVAPSEGGAA